MKTQSSVAEMSLLEMQTRLAADLYRFNANRDWPCSECSEPIKAGSEYHGEYGSQYGYKSHLTHKEIPK